MLSVLLHLLSLLEWMVSLGKDFVLVTPGIRPAGSDQGDQKRIMTPAQAMQAGSHYLVMGRPITKAEDPIAVLTQVNTELGVIA